MTEKIGPAPDHLSDDERLLWNEAAMLNDHLIAADAYMLEAFCKQFIRWRKLAKLKRPKPGQLAALKDAWCQLERSMGKLGFSPKDRKILKGAQTKPSKRESKLKERWT